MAETETEKKKLTIYAVLVGCAAIFKDENGRFLVSRHENPEMCEILMPDAIVQSCIAKHGYVRTKDIVMEPAEWVNYTQMQLEWDGLTDELRQYIAVIPGEDGWWKRASHDKYVELAARLRRRGINERETVRILSDAYSAAAACFGS